MYQFLVLIGPGAFSFLLVQFLMKDKEVSLINGIAQILTFSLINNVITVLALIQLSKVALVLNEDGTSYVQYGPVDIVFSMIVATLLSFAVVIIRKHVTMKIKIEGENEQEK